MERVWARVESNHRQDFIRIRSLPLNDEPSANILPFKFMNQLSWVRQSGVRLKLVELEVGSGVALDGR